MATKKSLFFVLILVLVYSPFSIGNLNFDYIFQFGDSLSDTGNFNWDMPNCSCSNFPYGESLHGRPPRCSNGLILIDYFAKFLKLPLLNPYLDKGADFRHGVNFAAAGSTVLDTSVLIAKNYPAPSINSSLSIQLDWFKSHLNSMCKRMSKCKKKLKKALIFVGEIGGNNYNSPLSAHTPMEEVYQMVPDVIQPIKDAVKELINRGATTMIIPGVTPLGCTPFYLVGYESNDPIMYDELNCIKSLNDFAKFHNNHLQEAIKELQHEYSQVTILYADYYSAWTWVYKNAPSLGFDKDEVQIACCGIGANVYNFDITRFCGSLGVPVCVNPNKRISWDGFHYTQHVYRLMAQWLLPRIIPDILQAVDTQVVVE